MLPKGNIQQKGYFSYRALCAVIHVVWIAAFLSLTVFEEILDYTSSCAPDFRWARILYISGSYNKGYLHCRSPPSDFDFAYQIKKSKLEELPMKEINLRDYYPFYTQDVIVEVPDEVELLLREYMLLEEAYRIRTYRYKAFYSLNRDEGIEREILQKPISPEEILEQRQMTESLYKGLAMLPEKQRQRIYAHFFLGMSKADIAKAEGTHKSRITRSIEAGLRRLEKYFKEIF